MFGWLDICISKLVYMFGVQTGHWVYVAFKLSGPTIQAQHQCPQNTYILSN